MRISNNNDNKNIPLLDSMKFGGNVGKNNTRCQSSQKRGAETHIIYQKSNIDVYLKYNKKDNEKIFNSYTNVYSNTQTNFPSNNTYQNFPNINKELSRQKLESVPNSAYNKTKLIKFNNLNNSSQINRQDVNNGGNKPKMLLIGNSDNIFSNVVASKRNKGIVKNKSFGIVNERNNEAKEIENMLNNLISYIPNYESNLDQDEYAKSFKGVKPYKNYIK